MSASVEVTHTVRGNGGHRPLVAGRNDPGGVGGLASSRCSERSRSLEKLYEGFHLGITMIRPARGSYQPQKDQWGGREVDVRAGGWAAGANGGSEKIDLRTVVAELYKNSFITTRHSRLWR